MIRFVLLNTIYSVLQVSISNLIWYLSVFHIYILETLTLLKSKGGRGAFFNFRFKITCWLCLIGSRLKHISHRNAQLLTFSKSLFSSFAEIFVMRPKKEMYHQQMTLH